MYWSSRPGVVITGANLDVEPDVNGTPGPSSRGAMGAGWAGEMWFGERPSLALPFPSPLNLVMIFQVTLRNAVRQCQGVVVRMVRLVTDALWPWSLPGHHKSLHWRFVLRWDCVLQRHPLANSLTEEFFIFPLSPSALGDKTLWRDFQLRWQTKVLA